MSSQSAPGEDALHIPSGTGHNTNLYSCDQCGKIYGTEFTLRRHKIQLHGQDLDQAHGRGRGFQRQGHAQDPHVRDERLRIQADAQDDQDPHVQDERPRIQADAQDDQDPHVQDGRPRIRAHGQDDQEGRFQCRMCPSVFSKQLDLDKHVKEHVSFFCDVCGQEFKKDYLLIYHKMKEHPRCKAANTPEAATASKGDEILDDNDVKVLDGEDDEARASSQDDKEDLESTLQQDHHGQVEVETNPQAEDEDPLSISQQDGSLDSLFIDDDGHVGTNPQELDDPSQFLDDEHDAAPLSNLSAPDQGARAAPNQEDAQNEPPEIEEVIEKLHDKESLYEFVDIHESALVKESASNEVSESVKAAELPNPSAKTGLDFNCPLCPFICATLEQLLSHRAKLHKNKSLLKASSKRLPVLIPLLKKTPKASSPKSKIPAALIPKAPIPKSALDPNLLSNPVPASVLNFLGPLPLSRPVITVPGAAPAPGSGHVLPLLPKETPWHVSVPKPKRPTSHFAPARGSAAGPVPSPAYSPRPGVAPLLQAIIRYRCRTCFQLFQSLRELKEHKDIAHKKVERQKVFIFPETGRKTPPAAAETVDDNLEMLYMCKTCSQIFKSREQFKIHQSSHQCQKDAKMNLYLCPVCFKLCSSQESLQRHRDQQHASPEATKPQESSKADNDVEMLEDDEGDVNTEKAKVVNDPPSSDKEQALEQDNDDEVRIIDHLIEKDNNDDADPNVNNDHPQGDGNDNSQDNTEDGIVTAVQVNPEAGQDDVQGVEKANPQDDNSQNDVQCLENSSPRSDAQGVDKSNPQDDLHSVCKVTLEEDDESLDEVNPQDKSQGVDKAKHPENDPITTDFQDHVQDLTLDNPQAVNILAKAVHDNDIEVIEEDVKVLDIQLSFRCLVCFEEVFQTKRELVEHHALKHADEAPDEDNKAASCELCLQSFSNAAQLDAHWESSHKKALAQLELAQPDSHHCSLCNKDYKSAKCLRDHRSAYHSGREPFQCEECPKSFLRKHVLHRHMLVHTRQVNFVCHICTKGFGLKQSLKIHMRLHMDQEQQDKLRKFPCEVCGYRFLTVAHVKKHQAVHNVDKVYKCYKCDKAYQHVSGLQRHHQQVHEEAQKTYQCSVCEKRFSRKDSLRYHEESHNHKKDKS